MHPRLSRLLLTAATLPTLGFLALGFLALGARPVAAGGPNGGTVVGGSATITGAGSSSVVINQTSGSAIINWTTFNIGVGDSVRFNQPSSSSIALNRVVGGLGPSEILGTLTANGRVFVINRDGVLFGPGAVINTAGFLATTNDIKNSDFMAGRMNFSLPGRPDASIVNQGHITATSGGFAALVAPGVRNSGTISATLGTVALASGNGFTLDLYGDKLVTLAVNDQIASKVIDVATGQPLKSLITNDGKIKANGGRVELTAAAARTVVDSVINTSGVITANSIGRHNGMIVLSAGTAGSKPAGAPTQTVRISGTVSAAGKKKGTAGGTILVTGEDIEFVGALVDASGRAGGGKVLIGGDWGGGKPSSGLVSNQSAKLEGYLIPTATTVSVDAATTIDASARDSGNGGKVILWSDAQTTFAGTILARGGADGGNGGFVETSGQVVDVTGSVNAGRGGLWLLDPDDLSINAPLAASISNTLNAGTNVVEQTTASGTGGRGDITVNASVAWNSSASLTLSAYHDIIVNSGVTITNIGSGSLALRADNTGLGSPGHGGTVRFLGYGNAVDFSNSSGAVSIYYNPAHRYSMPTNYTHWVASSHLTAYMLVNNAHDLQWIDTSVSGPNAYALGRDIDASSIQSFAPLASLWSPFNTVFDGQNHSISNLTIAPTDWSSNNIGLFAAIGAHGTVQNLTLANIKVTANPHVWPAGQFVGTLAGQNAGLISNVSVTGTVNATPHDKPLGGIVAGGLVGQNGIFNPFGVARGTIAQSTAAVAVTAGKAVSGDQANNVGGLVGINPGSIAASTSSGTISSGFNSFAGGLVGTNFIGGTITNSSSSGAVSGATGSASDFGSAIGGLVGFNSGSIFGSFATGNASGTAPSGGWAHAVAVGGLVGLNGSLGGITNSHASGAVTGTGQVELGGLVGGNFGSIGQSYATGPVTGSGTGMVGGLVGLNGGAFFHGNTLSGTITGSYASGPVAGTGSMRVGGLVGENEWRASIANSFATGAVTATAPGAVDIVAGGLVGENGGRITGSYATGAVTSHGGDATIGGLAGANDFWGTISNSSATGNVTADNAVNATAGGFVGGNAGTINSNSNSVISFATGNVSVNAVRGLAGGFVGLNLGGHIDHAYALGNVNVSGTTGIAGGFVGVNSGIAGEFDSTRGVLDQTLATGAVSGSATNSVLGGLAGVNTNLGTISQAYATGTVSGGAGSIVGGLAAVNVGTLDQTYAIGKLTGGAIIGGLVAANTSAPLAPALINDPGIGPTLSGTGVATNSYWNSQTTGVATSAGGTARTTNELIATLPPGFGPAWAVEPNPTYPNFPWLPFNPIPIVPEPVPDVQPPAPAQPQAQTQIIDNLVNTVALTTPATAPVVNGLGPLPPPSYPPLPPPGGAQQQPQGFQRIVDIPPLTETRFVNDEVLLQITSNRTIAELEAALRSFGLTLIASQQLGSANTTMLRFRITNGQSVRDVIQRLASVQIVAIMQPNYVYVLAQQPAADPAVPASRGDVTQQNDVGQYILQKFKLNDVHRIVRGTNVPIAVIDSEIDAAHPDLQGVIAQRFSAVGAPEKPHPHGTGMAGAIASHQRLIGIAPSARLYAVHAFSSNATSAESTTFNILKGLDWASSNGARIINMSFAGPKDPSLERALKAAYDKGIVLIAAAGNAGPKSPPLYPGADPNVIAVTATDVDDKLFPGANRGKYVAVAAPGVDILVPAPDAGYQLTTGTSVAAAEVSGIVALLLERNPKLTPADIRRILTGSAKRLGTAERDDDFGSGLADPLRALQSADPRTVGTTPPLRQR